MALQTAIEWTDTTWNPVSGCTEVSRGCDHCYAKRIAERFRGTSPHPFEHGFDLTLRHHKLDEPLKWRRPRRVFVNSMSDLFHKDIPIEFIDRVFATMEATPQHLFQILTKRSSLLRRYINNRYRSQMAPKHIWLGVSIEDRRSMVRLAHLRTTRAMTRFLSLEPLLEDVGKIDLQGIHWVIAGGESGPGARKVEPAWIRNIRDQCTACSVPFFFKQWGGKTSKAGGNELDGRRWLQFPLKREAPPAALPEAG